jgi:hypothetical protein
MTAKEFRALLLAVPGAVESSHMQHPDFRLGGRVFATLGYPDAKHGMLKVTPEEQAVLVAAEPEVFAPASGAWGRGGSTLVVLASAKKPSIARAVALAADVARSLGPSKSGAKVKATR